MAVLITKDDLASHIYLNKINAITRNNDELVNNSILAGINEAKSYLSRYQLDKIFNPDNPNFFNDENLKNKVKELVCWQLVKLSNPEVDLTLFRTNYEDAIEWLKLVRKGDPTPFGWLLVVDDPDTDYNEAGTLQWHSNRKRNNQY